MLQKVVFLDRDGVINRDSVDYIKNWSEFEFLPGSLDAIALLTRHQFTPMVITNQSAVHRGMISTQDLETIHTRMKAAVEARGGKISDIFFCPHLPEEACNCRKPRPGLLLRAQQLYRIDLSGACMIGDSASDIQCARNAGCSLAVLVETGDANRARKILEEHKLAPDYVARDLYAAVLWMLERFRSDTFRSE
jgi:D-glycero-D-manno-heptose 1,7-bisphosphate phosphatase